MSHAATLFEVVCLVAIIASSSHAKVSHDLTVESGFMDCSSSPPNSRPFDVQKNDLLHDMWPAGNSSGEIYTLTSDIADIM